MAVQLPVFVAHPHAFYWDLLHILPSCLAPAQAQFVCLRVLGTPAEGCYANATAATTRKPRIETHCLV